MQLTHRVFWLITGSISLLLGLIGVILPLLPTTPFLLLASASFMKSSPKANQWLLSHSLFGPPIIEWQQRKSMKKTVRKKVFFLIVLSFSVSIFLAPLVWVKAGLLGLALLLLFGITKIPTSE